MNDSYRDKLYKVFNDYASKYNLEDPKIRLKKEHTLRVADLSDQIFDSIMDEYELNRIDRDIAWTIAMLHDVGRFEQAKHFNTFFDSQSVNHAEFGADLLFLEDEELRKEYEKTIPHMDFLQSRPNLEEVNLLEKEVVELAIRNHNRYRIADGLSDREKIFCNIIRDADKIDILKVNLEFSIEEIYNVSMDDLLNSDISDRAIEALLEGHAVKRDQRLTPMDLLVGHASMMQELVFEESRKIVREQGYLKKLLDKKPVKKETREKLEVVRKHMQYLM